MWTNFLRFKVIELIPHYLILDQATVPQKCMRCMILVYLKIQIIVYSLAKGTQKIIKEQNNTFCYIIMSSHTSNAQKIKKAIFGRSNACQSTHTHTHKRERCSNSANKWHCVTFDYPQKQPFIFTYSL